MYLVDFIKSLIKRGSVSIIVYLCINIIIIMLIVGVFFSEYTSSSGQSVLLSAIGGLALYVISLTIALSPIGEFILRFQLGCKEIKRIDQINAIEPLFREVYAKAKQLDPSLSDDIRLFINSDDTINAFATGRKTICINRGLLALPSDQIKATLAHEFGHISHKDTDLILVISVGNFIVTALISIIKIIAVIISAIMGIALREGSTILIYISIAIVSAFMWIWTKFGTILVMKSSRDSEFKADEFAYNLGYGNSLCALIETFTDTEEKGLFAALSKSHPDKDERIGRMQALGAEYRAGSDEYVFQEPNITDAGQPITESRTSYSIAAKLSDRAGQQTQESPDNRCSWDSVSSNDTNNCAHCGASLVKDAKYCRQCGKPVDTCQDKKLCPKCGAKVGRKDANFCPKCGTRLMVH